MQVYCDECKHFVEVRAGSQFPHEFSCTHEKNKGTWKSRKQPKKLPLEINSHNDCKWFEKKEGIG